MAEKQWNDKLRQSMADYSQTPPDGLWDAIDARVHKPAAPVFPWWWALAGAAAAVVAVLMLWPRTVAVPDVKQDVSQVVVSSDTLDMLPPVEIETAPEAAETTPAEAEKAPVAIQTAPVRQLVASKNDGGAAPAEDVAEGQPEGQKAKPVDATEAGHPETEGQASTDTEKSREKAEKDSRPDTRTIDIIPENLDHQSPGTKPRLAQAERRTPAVAFVGAGVPGGGVSSTITEYAMSAAGKNGSRAASPMATLLSRNKTITTTSNHKMTFRAGLMLNSPVSRHFSVESGLLYTILSSDVTSQTGSIETVNQKNMRYLGIPIQAVYTPLSTRHFSCYLSAGPMLELNLLTNWLSSGKIGGSSTGHDSGSEFLNERLWSLGANAGVQWHPYSKGAFFLQPGISWHIPKEGIQESLYTAQPFAFTISAGYRVFF